MANYKLEYSQIVLRKLKSLHAYLKAEFGEEVSKSEVLAELKTSLLSFGNVNLSSAV